MRVDGTLVIILCFEDRAKRGVRRRARRIHSKRKLAGLSRIRERTKFVQTGAEIAEEDSIVRLQRTGAPIDVERFVAPAGSGGGREP